MQTTRMQATKIVTDDTYKELQLHGTADYPIRYYYEDIYLFDLHCIEWHWHPELELIYAEKGSFTALIGNAKIVMKAGDALLVNQNVIHRMEATEHAIIPNVVFLPKLMASEDSLIYKKYIAPVLKSSVDYIHFTSEVPWKREAIEIMKSLFSQIEEEHELNTIQLLLGLWNLIFENLEDKEQRTENNQKILAQTRLQIMMSFLQNNYSRSISLDEIAETVSLSKNGILNIFNEYLHVSPVNYLIQYRLKVAANLLKTTEAHIDTIAADTGFHNIGYFCRKFKMTYSMTPSEYREHKGDD